MCYQNQMKSSIVFVTHIRDKILRMEQKLKTTPKNVGGRPKLPDGEKLIVRSIRLSKEDWAELDANGMPWLREVFAKSRRAKLRRTDPTEDR